MAWLRFITQVITEAVQKVDQVAAKMTVGLVSSAPFMLGAFNHILAFFQVHVSLHHFHLDDSYEKDPRQELASAFVRVLACGDLQTEHVGVAHRRWWACC